MLSLLLPGRLLEGIEFLRISKIEISLDPGNLPALENADGDIFGKLGGEFETSQHLIDCLKAEGNDLDSKLSRIQQGQAVAFAALMRSQLEPATIYTSWCESESFSKHMRVRYAMLLSKAGAR